MCDDGNNNCACGWDAGDCCGADVQKTYCVAVSGCQAKVVIGVRYYRVLGLQYQRLVCVCVCVSLELLHDILHHHRINVLTV